MTGNNPSEAAIAYDAGVAAGRKEAQEADPAICLNCKHWGAKRAAWEKSYNLEGIDGRMRCALALDVYQPPDTLKVHLKANGYECEGAEMFTSSDYGCVQYEAKP